MSKGFKNQLAAIFNFDGDNGAVMVNNYDWAGSMDIVTFLRDIGKHIGVNYMLAKDTIASRTRNWNILYRIHLYDSSSNGF